MGKLDVEIQDGIGWIHINNELRRNAIDEEIMNSFTYVLDELEHNSHVKILVITGKGNKSFCSGGDLSVFHNLHTEEESYAMLSKMAANLLRLFTFPKPTIALLNGAAVGGGCEIASACDFRVAVQGAKLGFIQGTLGITTGWGGSTYLMERLSKTKAFHLLTSGEIFTSEEAVDLGFIQQIIAVESLIGDFNDWINPIIQKPLSVLEAYKARLLDSFNLDLIEKRIDKEVRHCAKLWESDEHHLQVQAFLIKRSE